MIRNAVTALAAVCLLAAGSASLDAHAASDADLQAAREELRLRTETERRMREEFESLLAAGSMSAAEIADFENYLSRLGAMVDEQRRTLARLNGDDPGDPGSAPLAEDFNRGQTDEEKIALLDAELDGSLSEFDEKLLREQKEISEKSRASTSTDSGASGERSSASGEGGDGGEGAEGQGESEGEAKGKAGGEQAGGDGQFPAGGEGEAGESAQTEESGQAGETGGQRAEGDDQVASAGGKNEGGTRVGTSSIPPDIPDGKDDDIVARQLREAAESEQDPELREKLWDEYRKYKKRTP